jgi:hypothetical protein
MSARRTFAMLAVVLAPSSAWAQAGRLDGDVGLSIETGASFGQTTAGTIAGRALYLATAGAYGSFAAGGDGYRLASVGVELRPLFIPRFLRNMEGSRDVFELTIDSLAIDLGAAKRDRIDDLFLELGLGLEVPFFGRYAGPFFGLRVARDIAPDSLRGGAGGETRGMLTLGYRATLNAHLVDAGDRSSR